MYPNNNCTACVPCPDPLYPGTDYSHTLCTSSHDDKCVIYTGADIPCLNITTGMTVYEIFEIFKTISLACCVTNCQVSDWSAWSACNPATGTKTRTRTAITEPSVCAPACPPLTETTTCPVDCIQSEWGPFGPCVDGEKTRTRTIIQQPLNGGTPCGPPSETVECCVRPAGLTLQSYLAYAWTDGVTNYPFSSGTVEQVCSAYVDYKAVRTTGFTSAYALETGSMTVGQTAYVVWNATDCEVIPNGNYWYIPNNQVQDYTNVSDIIVVTILAGIITNIATCPLLPLSLISSEENKFDVKLSTSSSSLLVNWGDGTIEGYTTATDTITISHTYGAAYTGEIRMRSSLGNANIKEFSNFIVTDNTFNSIAFTTAQLGAFTGLTKFICTDSTVGTISNKISGNVDALPAGLQSFICGGSNNTFGTMISLPRSLTIYENTGLNTTSGDIKDLPPNLTLYRNRGNNTTSGDIKDLPITLITYANEGANRTFGNIGNLKPTLTSYSNRGINYTSGDIGNLPVGITYFLNEGNGTLRDQIAPFQTTTGNLFGLTNKTSLTYYSNKGKNTTSGDIANLPASLKTFQNWGAGTLSTDVAPFQVTSGNINSLPAILEFYDNQGQNAVTGTLQTMSALGLKVFDSRGLNTITGEIHNIPSTLLYFDIRGNSTDLEYATKTWAEGVQHIYIDDADFTIADTSQLVIDLALVTWNSYFGKPKSITTTHKKSILTLNAQNAIITLNVQGVAYNNL